MGSKYGMGVGLLCLALTGCSESGGAPGRDDGQGVNIAPDGDTTMTGAPGRDATMAGTPGGEPPVPGMPGGDTSTSGSGGTGGGMSVEAGDGDNTGGDDTTTIPDLTVDIAECGMIEPDSCKPTAEGIYAVKTTIDVWWEDDADPPLVDPGRANIVVHLMGEITGVGDDGMGEGVMKGCGTQLPVFKSDANCDAFQIEFPDAIWDEPTMPTFTTAGMTSGFDPGDILTIAKATGLVGIDLSDPSGAWPTPAQTGTVGCSAGSGEVCFPDHDGDGNPGITVRMVKRGTNLTQNGCGGFDLPFVHRGAPLDALGALDDNGVKAEILHIGVRTILGGGGAIACDCMSGAGESTAEALDSRVWGCVRTDDAPCDAAQAAFVDESAPNYNILNKGETVPDSVMTLAGSSDVIDRSPSIGPISEVLRLGDLGESYSCADVRTALP